MNHSDQAGRLPLMAACRAAHAELAALLMEVRQRRCASEMGGWGVLLPMNLSTSSLPAGRACLLACLPAACLAHPQLPDSVANLNLQLQHGADIDAIDGMGRTALMYAAAGGSAAIVAALLQRGADPNLADHNGASPLIMATNGGHCHLVEPLVVSLLLVAGGVWEAGMPVE